MRKALWIMLAVLSLAIAVPSAQANPAAVSMPSAQADPLFTYTFTSPANDAGVSFTTMAIPAVTMETTVPVADLTSLSISTSSIIAVDGCTITSVVLDAPNFVFTPGAIGFNVTGCFTSNFTTLDVFALADYSTPGTYTDSGFFSTHNTLVVTAAVVTPEPGSVVLMLLGAGLLLFVTRKPGKKVGHPVSA